MLVAMLKQAKEMARTVACAANLHGRGLALYYYAEDHEDHIPACLYGDEKFWEYRS